MLLKEALGFAMGGFTLVLSAEGKEKKWPMKQGACKSISSFIHVSFFFIYNFCPFYLLDSVKFPNFKLDSDSSVSKRLIIWFEV